MIIIRSKEKKTIGKYVEIIAEEDTVIGVTSSGSKTELGTYVDKERAIKVIDYIHKFIQDGYKKDYLDNKYRVMKEEVFIMPGN